MVLPTFPLIFKTTMKEKDVIQNKWKYLSLNCTKKLKQTSRHSILAQFHGSWKSELSKLDIFLLCLVHFWHEAHKSIYDCGYWSEFQFYEKKNYTICDRFKYMCYASEGSIVIFSGKADNTKRPRTVERSQYKNISISIARKELWIALN